MKPRYHICILAWNFPVRSETFIREHALGLAQRGHLVTVVSRGPGEGIPEEETANLRDEGIRLANGGGLRRGTLAKPLHFATLLGRKPSRLLWLWTRDFPERYLASFTKETVEALRPDILHVHYGTHGKALQQAGVNLPTVVTWHGHDANVVPRERGANVYWDLFHQPWQHTVGSAFMRERLLALGANDEHLSLIPMGIDLTQFSWRDRAERKDKPVRLLAVGRLDEMKGHTFLIAATAGLIREGWNIILHIVGEGLLRRKLEAQIADTGLGERIVLCGGRSSREVVREMHEADIFCLTGVPAQNGRVETQGVVLAEAQATGLPVIASSVGGVPDSLVDGVTGLLCQPGDIASIQKAIRHFLKHPDQRREFGRRGRAYVKDRFSLETMNDRFEALYSEITSRHRINAGSRKA